MFMESTDTTALEVMLSSHQRQCPSGEDNKRKRIGTERSGDTKAGAGAGEAPTKAHRKAGCKPLHRTVSQPGKVIQVYTVLSYT